MWDALRRSSGRKQKLCALRVVDDGVAASSSVRPDQFQLSAGTCALRGRNQPPSEWETTYNFTLNLSAIAPAVNSIKTRLLSSFCSTSRRTLPAIHEISRTTFVNWNWNKSKHSVTLFLVNCAIRWKVMHAHCTVQCKTYNFYLLKIFAHKWQYKQHKICLQLSVIHLILLFRYEKNRKQPK